MASIVQPGTKGAQLSCYTAPGVIFESPLALREHYKTDWHRYNLKRKVSGLPPISATSFQKRREAAAKFRCLVVYYWTFNLGEGPFALAFTTTLYNIYIHVYVVTTHFD